MFGFNILFAVLLKRPCSPIKGEILAMASVPDYDPNHPSQTLPDGGIDKEYEKGWFNRMSNATFEMGSTFKSFTIAMGLDSGKIGLDTVVDASRPIRMGGFTISDFHGRQRPLTVSEVFRYSSNIATVKIADMVGIDPTKRFLADWAFSHGWTQSYPKSLHRVTLACGRRSTRPLSPTAMEWRRHRCKQPLQPPHW